MDLTCTVPAGNLDATATRRRSLASFFIPDLAVLASLVTLIYCLFLFDGAHQLFRDSDAGWHIRNGEAILSGAGLPHTDSWSFMKTGQPWFAWEWGSDVLAGAAHILGGPGFVAGLYALVIAACTFLWFRLQWRCGGSFLLAGGMSILLLTTCNIHWHARPHVFSWALLLVALLYLESDGRRLLAIAALSAVWANLHASFFLLPVVLLIYAAACFLRPLIWAGIDLEAEEGRWFAWAAAVALGASLLNPYGWNLHAHVFRYLTDSELLDRVGEFQSFNFHAEGAWQILFTIGIAALGAVLAFGQRRLAHVALSILFLATALRSARALPVVALVVLPLANGAITRALRNASGLQPALRRSLDAFLQYADNLRTLDKRFSGAAIVPIAILCLLAILPALPSGFPPDQFPVRASEQIALLPPAARILAPDMYGGYLIYRFNGARKVWFDGRSDFYGADYMKDYLRLIEIRPGWSDRLKQIGFTHALLPNRYSLIPALESAGWKKLYSDNVATLLAAPAEGKN